MSNRGLDADLLAGAQSTEFRYVVLVDLAFPSGTVRVHNSVGTLSFGGNDYLGVGAFGQIDAISEGIDLADNPIRLSLSSIDEGIISAMQTDDIYGRAVNIYLGSLDENNQIKGTPTNWITGYMENAALTVGSNNVVNINIQTAAARLLFRNNKRFTSEELQRTSPGDRFFSFLPTVIAAEITWGGDLVRTGFTNDGGAALTRAEQIRLMFPNFWRGRG